MRRYCQKKRQQKRVPEKAKEEGKPVICPTGAIHDFNKYGMRVEFIFLNNGKGNDQGQCRANVEKRIIL